MHSFKDGSSGGQRLPGRRGRSSGQAVCTPIDKEAPISKPPEVETRRTMRELQSRRSQSSRNLSAGSRRNSLASLRKSQTTLEKSQCHQAEPKSPGTKPKAASPPPTPEGKAAKSVGQQVGQDRNADRESTLRQSRSRRKTRLQDVDDEKRFLAAVRTDTRAIDK